VLVKVRRKCRHCAFGNQILTGTIPREDPLPDKGCGGIISDCGGGVVGISRAGDRHGDDREIILQDRLDVLDPEDIVGTVEQAGKLREGFRAGPREGEAVLKTLMKLCLESIILAKQRFRAGGESVDIPALGAEDQVIDRV